MSIIYLSLGMGQHCSHFKPIDRKCYMSQAYELNISDFIVNLQSETQGVVKLEEAMKAMTDVFKSYRFINYLLSPYAAKYPPEEKYVPTPAVKVYSDLNRYNTFSLVKRLVTGRILTTEVSRQESQICNNFFC